MDLTNALTRMAVAASLVAICMSGCTTPGSPIGLPADAEPNGNAHDAGDIRSIEGTVDTAPFEVEDADDAPRGPEVDTSQPDADTKSDIESSDAPDVCTPECTGKECGPDGCGGVCGECPWGYQCRPNEAEGQCSADCLILCTDRECGSAGENGECDCGQCADAYDCTADACEDGLCAYQPDDAACDDGNLCTDDTCDPQAGCVYVPNDANACSDGDPCDGEEDCVGGECMPGTPLDCDDSKPCTDDVCVEGEGCVNTPNDDNSCSDDDPCGGEEECVGGECVPGAPPDCDDGEPCTDDVCVEGEGCVNTPNNDNVCADEDACNGVESCLDGECAPGPPPDCNDDNACTDDACEPEMGCVYVPNDDNSCSDDDPCDGEEECVGGECMPGAPPDCDDDNKCTLDTCDSTVGCVYEEAAGICDDELVCTDDTCNDDTCFNAIQSAFCVLGEECLPGGALHADNVCLHCEPAVDQIQWTAVANGTACGDGMVCYQGSCCSAAANCEGKECGDDGCGGSCGGCQCGHECLSGICVFTACDGRECGDDGCGGSCGECPESQWIVCIEAGQCADICIPNCEGRECGYDPCGFMCGECPADSECNDWGQCVGKCQWECLLVECGYDGCGGSCWQCPEGQYCSGGFCTDACVPDCDGKECGDDGCGGSCGECPENIVCTAAGVCGGKCAYCPAPEECHNIDFSEGTLSSWRLGYCVLGESEFPCNHTGTVMEKFGTSSALTGGQMLVLDSDLFKTFGFVDMQVCVQPPGCYVLSVVWRLYSSGFPFDDPEDLSTTDEVRMLWRSATTGPQGVEVYLEHLLPPEWCETCGKHYADLEYAEPEAGIATWGGLKTPWMETNYAFAATENQQPITLQLGLVTYLEYNRTVVLIDQVQFIPCDEFCDGRECGTSPILLAPQCGDCSGGRCGPHGICEPACVPDCDFKCGWDGCGQWCGPCNPGLTCTKKKTCVLCPPECEGMECGRDWCSGKWCGECEECGEQCMENECVFLPCHGKECGSDGCGGWCGDCADGEVCIEGICCAASCEGRECGPDGCGGMCGTCLPGAGCIKGQCIPLGCGDKECGNNGYGGTCGICQAPAVCVEGACVEYNGCGGCEPNEVCVPPDDQCCQPQCAGKVCGDDGCGGVCGECGCGESCAAGACLFSECDGMECGDDLCGGSCGQCGDPGEVCFEGQCCTPDCQGKECGTDGCGGSCGGCGEAEVCHEGQCCVPDCQGKVCGTDGCGGDCGLCDDDNLCTADECQEPDGVCMHPWISGCCLEAGDCDDADECTDDTCLDDHTCLNEGACCDVEEDCDDGEPTCTDDTCVDGKCVFEPTWAEGCCVQALFMDDFFEDLGWTYGEYWERGPAQASECGLPFEEDPAIDHTDSDDNYVAGVVLGGCYPKQHLPASYLTSPVVPCSELESVTLSYWRWLNTDDLPQVVNMVDVFDGEGWVTIWETAEMPLYSGLKWTPMAHDITEWANPELQVRFGFEVLGWGPTTRSSWNLDDIIITTTSDQMCCRHDSDCDAAGLQCNKWKCE